MSQQSIFVGSVISYPLFSALIIQGLKKTPKIGQYVEEYAFFVSLVLGVIYGVLMKISIGGDSWPAFVLGGLFEGLAASGTASGAKKVVKQVKMKKLGIDWKDAKRSE